MKREVIACDILRSRTQFLFRIQNWASTKSQDVYLAISPLPLSLSRLICHVFMKLKENR